MKINKKTGQHNFKILRRFQEDITGVLGLRNKPSKVLDYIYEAYQNNFKYRKLLRKTNKSFFLVSKKDDFNYKIITDEKEFKRKKKTIKIHNYINLLKLRRFYGNIGKKKFKRNFNNLIFTPQIATRSFAYFLESRLDVVLYRANFFKSIFAARQYINHKKVFVNGILVNKPGYSLKIDDIVSVNQPDYFYESIKNRLTSKKILCNYPSYLYVNYKLGLIKLIKLPLIKEVPFPFFINLERMTNNFYK
jgi:ribosomal protein S4